MTIEQQTTLTPLGPCGRQGYVAPLTWAAPPQVWHLEHQLTQADGLGNVTANPHRTQDWARELVVGPALVEQVSRLIGARIAVENTFLICKRPGDGFAVPPHQDGINDRIELDPARAVAVWLAITEAAAVSGCLEVVPGSHRAGYLPYRRASSGPLTTRAPGDLAGYMPLPLHAGQACALDVRLVHRSAPNTGPGPRVGLNIRYVAPGGIRTRAGPPPELFPVTGDFR